MSSSAIWSNNVWCSVQIRSSCSNSGTTRNVLHPEGNNRLVSQKAHLLTSWISKHRRIYGLQRIERLCLEPSSNVWMIRSFHRQTPSLFSEVQCGFQFWAFLSRRQPPETQYRRRTWSNQKVMWDCCRTYQCGFFASTITASKWSVQSDPIKYFRMPSVYENSLFVSRNV